MNITTTNVTAAAALFAVVGATDYFLDRSLKRALIVGGVAVVAAIVILYFENQASRSQV
jgi:drug/metabolite transporter (DMT)-like permease